jgi:Flp pilus assembly protein TadD
MRTITLALAVLFFFWAPPVRAQGTSRLPGNTPRYASTGSGMNDVLAPFPVNVDSPLIAHPTGSETLVSVDDLAVPSKAATEFARSVKALRTGDAPAAAAHLEKAVRIAPEFAEAQNNLGAVYIHLRQYENAVPHLQKAVELAPKAGEPYNNLGMALLFLRRFPEAESAARRSVELTPQRSSPRYTLGRVLVMEGRDTPEAVEMLTAAAGDFPQARLLLAEVLQARGSAEQAIAELRTYLNNPEPGKKQLVEAWLAHLQALSAGQVRPAEPPKP